jgi:hypothetical protein
LVAGVGGGGAHLTAFLGCVKDAVVFVAVGGMLSRFGDQAGVTTHISLISSKDQPKLSCPASQCGRNRNAT